MLEKLLANYCAPALAGIKPSSIVTYRKTDGEVLRREAECLGKELSRCGISIEILCECEKSAIIIAYRREALERQLSNAENRAFLANYGYTGAVCAADYLNILRSRMSCGNFPHEIGIFLGYPLRDVHCFITHRDEGCIMTGDWKVYHDADGAMKKFRRFKACRREVSRRIDGGMTLAEIFRTANKNDCKVVDFVR